MTTPPMTTPRTFKTPRRSLHRPLPSAPQVAAAMLYGMTVMGHFPRHCLPIVPERADERPTAISLIFPPAAAPGNHGDAHRTPYRAGSRIG